MTEGKEQPDKMYSIIAGAMRKTVGLSYAQAERDADRPKNNRPQIRPAATQIFSCLQPQSFN